MPQHYQNYIQHNDTQHKVALGINGIKHNNALPLCWVSHFIYFYAEYHYAEWRDATLTGLDTLAYQSVMFYSTGPGFNLTWKY